MASAILTETYIRSTYITDQSEFIENLQSCKHIGKLLDMPKRPQALNSTFKIDFKKGLDSEDADRRDSINRFRLRSFCRASEKLYNKPIASLPHGKTQKSV